MYIVSCMCLLSALKQKMNDFLHTYRNKLGEKKRDFTDEQSQIVLSAVVMLLRRHGSDNRLCCNNDANDLQVTGIDRFGFVTQVICKECNKHMDTSSYDGWTKETIHDESVSQLKVGDHICWNRWYAIWHHAIVSKVDPLKVIHYEGGLEVLETDFSKATYCRKSGSCCDALYRINYEDCYNADYTVLRAQRLLNQTKYNLVEQNCEHFSIWCKTGSTKSSQVCVFWKSLGKIAVTVGLRLVALLILFLIQYSYERFEYHVENRQVYANVEKQLTCVYIVVFTLIFVIHLVITAGKRLQADSRSRKFDIENPCSRGPCDGGADREPPSLCGRLWICCQSTCYSLFCTPVLVLFAHCKECYNQCDCCCCCMYCCICCERPGNLACGLFCRFFLREIPGLIGTVCIVEYEDTITYPIADRSAIVRTLVIISCIITVQLVGYIVGALLGRWIEACCECSSWNVKSSYGTEPCRLCNFSGSSNPTQPNPLQVENILPNPNPIQPKITIEIKFETGSVSKVSLSNSTQQEITDASV